MTSDFLEPTERIVVLWNPTSGSAGRAAAARTRLEECDRCEVRETTSAEDAQKQAAQLAEEGESLVLAAGGDGSVNAVLQGLMQRPEQVRFGVLPAGTGNDLCRTLGVPLDPLLAAEYYTSSDPIPMRSIDVVQLRSASRTQWFANMATAGNTGRYSGLLTDEMKAFWGPMCYLRGAVDVISDLTVHDLTIRFDDDPPQRLQALNVLVANGRTSGGGLQAAPHASIEDGLLDVVVVLDGRPLDLAGLATRYLLSDYLESELIVHQRVHRVSLESEPTMTISADGDVAADDPAEFTVHERALRVVVGSEYFADPPVARELSTD